MLQVKRNEAICCLIGFGIGISCCLMYRWFKSSFGLARNECELQAQVVKPKTPTAANTSTFTLTTHKLAKKARKPKKSSKSSSSSSAHSLNSAFVFPSVKQPTHHAQSVLNDEPLNDVYLNLAKFLSRQFCRSIKLRRPSKKQRQRTLPTQCAPPLYNNVNNLNESKVNATSNIHSTDNKPNNSVQYLDKFLKLEFKTNSTESLDKHTASNYFNSENSSRPPAFLKSLTNLSIIDRPENNIKNPIMRSKITTSSNVLANNKNKSYTSNEATYFDEDSFDLFGITSHRSSVFDLDDISGKIESNFSYIVQLQIDRNLCAFRLVLRLA